MSADESGACSVAEEEGVQEWVEWYFRKGDASQWACGHCHVDPPLSRWPTLAHAGHWPSPVHVAWHRKNRFKGA